MLYKGYEMVLGLEVHVELKTATKIFCGCSTSFGAAPNTHVCPVCMGYPGSLPVLNRKVVEYALKAGMATHSKIARYSKQDRKNYFYPDLPKAYQISQYDLPLCEHGYLDIETGTGAKRIGITRIHIEEDAGKLIHDPQKGTMLDCNRCGVPLIEIVSEPDLRSAEEADAYLKKLRSIIVYTGISDCKMNEGAFRCDVNLSVRKPGEPFGTRTEMKNLNSFSFIQKAIEYEYKRQADAIEAGEEIVQETRRFDEATGKTFSMRKKEDANDYRYFPDPDLPPIEMPETTLVQLRESIPELPDQRKALYVERYGLSPYDSEKLTEEKAVADYFEQAAGQTKYPKILANLLLSEFLRLLPEGEEIGYPAGYLASIADMSGEGQINSSTAKKVLKESVSSKEDPALLVERKGLKQIRDREALAAVAAEVLAENEKSVKAYRQGRSNAFQALMGSAMAKTQGRGDPELLAQLLTEGLKETE